MATAPYLVRVSVIMAVPSKHLAIIRAIALVLDIALMFVCSVA